MPGGLVSRSSDATQALCARKPPPCPSKSKISSLTSWLAGLRGGCPMLALGSLRRSRFSRLKTLKTCATNGEASSEIEVWSFNLRTEKVKEEDPLNAWPERRQGVASLIAKYRPAVVCVQEATVAMLHDICLHLDGKYEWKATSRLPNEPDESAGFIIDTGRAKILDYSVFWLSSPGAPDGIPSWDARFPRTCEAVLLDILGSGGLIRILNTHFDHQGSTARLESARMISDSIARFSQRMPACAQILCGDFNSPKSSEPYAVLVGNLGPTTTAARPLKMRSDATVWWIPVACRARSTSGRAYRLLRIEGTARLICHRARAMTAATLIGFSSWMDYQKIQAARDYNLYRAR